DELRAELPPGDRVRPPGLPVAVHAGGCAGGRHLRPWLVLIVVEQQAGVTIGVQPGAPLPVLHIAAPANAANELPDLAESWAWAHTQVVTADNAPALLASDLASAPDLNVSRIVSPRRLGPAAA